jgi:predicted thioesterase
VNFVVSDEMRPIFDRIAVHQVCSTWSLVHYMELAGRKILLEYLESHEEGVGSRVECDHMAPARVGRTVRVVATVSSVNDRELVCDVVAFNGPRMVASGRTWQRVFPRPVLERILERG